MPTPVDSVVQVGFSGTPIPGELKIVTHISLLIELGVLEVSESGPDGGLTPVPNAGSARGRRHRRWSTCPARLATCVASDCSKQTV